MEKVIDRLIRYVKIDTQADPNSDTTPSTKKQFDLANLLVKELKNIGIADAHVDDKCYVMATVPGNITGKKVPTIGFVAHMDTSPDAPATNIQPQVLENYQGGDITLPNGIVIREDESPALKKCIGHTIVHTDGTTLLSSDDKSGVSAIMAAAEYLMTHPEIKHGDIRIGFTPDEEIGRGANHFDIEKFGAEYAYTIDGEMPGQLNRETFSADMANVTVTGREIHPGSAKDIMVNAVRVLSCLIDNLPKKISPEHTEGHQPYLHPNNISGEVKKATSMFLLRAFNNDDLKQMSVYLEEAAEKARKEFPKAQIDIEYTKQYRNMYEWLKDDPKGLDYMFEAAKRAGADPYWEPIRGGTDGSRLTEMGLPCPNIFTGGQNFHSVTEWVSIDALQMAVDTIIELAQVWAEE
ncbi:MAG: peptidase T [Candidatus Kapaibacteriales bacterium]